MDRPVKVALIRARPTVRPVLIAVLILLLAGCSTRRRVPSSEPAGATMGVYRATVEAPQGGKRKFRLLLYAQLPDRLHGEILSPVGTTEVIVDGGGGQVAITIPRERVSYVGAGDADAMAKVVGVRLSLAELVSALLLGSADSVEDYQLERRPANAIGLPKSIDLSGSGYRLGLVLRKLQPLRISTATLGNGEPPPGTELRPLEGLGQLTDAEELSE